MSFPRLARQLVTGVAGSCSDGGKAGRRETCYVILCHSRAGGNPAQLHECCISTCKRHRSDEEGYYVYIMASGSNRTLYVGVTNDLVRRVDEHRQGTASGFTKRYGVHRLVYYGDGRGR